MKYGSRASPHAPTADLDDAAYETCLRYVHAQAAGPVAGVFGPESLAWRMNREVGILLGGMRALLLQLAHPAVAAGVHQHSAFRQDILGRSRRTAAAMYQLVFGDLAQALETSRRLYAVHRRIRGHIETTGASAPTGQPYQANDPGLLLWVLATLYDTSRLMYEQLVAPLTPEEHVRAHEETRLMAALMGIPPDAFPATPADFKQYFQSMLEDDVLVVGPVSRDHAQILLHAPFVPTSFVATLTAGLLPPTLCEGFGLRWDARTARRHQRLMVTLSGMYRCLPDVARTVPAYHQALLRIARARQQRPPLSGRVIEGLQRIAPLPLTLNPATSTNS